MKHFFHYVYHLGMATYHGWCLRREIRRLRRMGKIYNLPSLDAYSDEAIIQGFINLQKEKNNAN